MREIENLPQLMVALDDDGNYTHIYDVKEDTNYYCPCCNNKVLPRAWKEEKVYEMQPHFYHVNGSCNKESQIHWMYKNYLFAENSKFKVNDEEFTVKSIDTEQEYETDYGTYIPDITVTTTNNTTLFFEINFSNKKKANDYFGKWSELNIPVVEVDVKNLLNSPNTEAIPEFKYLYKDHECFKKEYIKRDKYYTVYQYKKNCTRQDKIDDKIRWMKLDWFWRDVTLYKSQKCSADDVVESFKKLNFEDMGFCINIIKAHKLNEIKQKCIEINNNVFVSKLIIHGIYVSKFSTVGIRFSKKYNGIVRGISHYDIIYRKQFYDIDLYNDIINKFHIDDIENISNIICSLDKKYIDDIKEAYIYGNNVNIKFNSDRQNERGIQVEVLNITQPIINDSIDNYYNERKLSRFSRYKENKKSLIEYDYEIFRKNQIKNKRALLTHIIDEYCNKINECRNKQWHCVWDWKNDVSVKIELYFDLDESYNCKSDLLPYMYKYYLSFTVKEYDIKNLKEIIEKYMNKLYKKSGCESTRLHNNDVKYRYFGIIYYRKLFIDSEVTNG